MSTRSGPMAVLHTTPPLSPLPASDAESLRLLCTLLLGGARVAVQTADWASNGKPLVTLNRVSLRPSSFPTLTGYTSPDDRAHLPSTARADSTEWAAYIDAQLTDLVNHSLYSLPANYAVLRAAQLAELSWPASMYVTQRVRGIHAARLRAVGLWGVGGGDDDEDGERVARAPAAIGNDGHGVLDDAVVVAPGGTRAPRAWAGWNGGREAAERKRTFGEEKIRQRAKAALEPLKRRLGRSVEGGFFFGHMPTSLDIALFAQLSLVLDTDLPNPLLANVLRESYPTLVAHHDRMLARINGGWEGIARKASPAPPSLWGYAKAALPWQQQSPSASASASGSSNANANAGSNSNADPPSSDKKKEAEKKNRDFAYARWAWFAGTGVALVTYLLASGMVQIDFSDDDDEWSDEEDDDDDEDVDEDQIIEVVEAFEYTPGSGLPVWDDDEEEAAAREE